MSDNQWGEDDQQPVKKKGLPTWAKIGCGGCGIVLLVVILGVGFLFTKFKDAANPDVQWPALAEVIAYDERPAGYMIIGAQWPQEQYTLTNTSTGMQGQFTLIAGGQGKEGRDDIFGGDTPKMPTNLVIMKFADFEKGTVEVQGRELPIVRFRMEPGGLMKKAADGENPLGPACFIDLSQPGGDFLLFQLTCPRQDGPVADEQIQAFLAPFHVGPDRAVFSGVQDAVRDRLKEAVDQSQEAMEEALEEALEKAPQESVGGGL